MATLEDRAAKMQLKYLQDKAELEAAQLKLSQNTANKNDDEEHKA